MSEEKESWDLFVWMEGQYRHADTYPTEDEAMANGKKFSRFYVVNPWGGTEYFPPNQDED